MPLEWTHESKTCPQAKACTGETDCLGFPTVTDRVDMARAAFEEYSESDGTSIYDFFSDVCMLMLADTGKQDVRQQVQHLLDSVHSAAANWEREGQRIAGFLKGGQDED